MNARQIPFDQVNAVTLDPGSQTEVRAMMRTHNPLSMMLTRVAQRDLPARDTRLRCELIVRESCGTPA